MLHTVSFRALRYFSERVSPAVHDAAAKKEAFGAWNEDFIQQHHMKAVEEGAKRHKVHIRTRAHMLVK
jgi:hypothetical protein